MSLFAHTEGFHRLWKGVCVLLVFAVWIPAARAGSDEHPMDYVPYALSISGGVSLGSYEAGLNWALVHFMRAERRRLKHKGLVYPKLTAVTGASAGSINALFSAISWCVDETRLDKSSYFSDRIDRNLFRDVWLAIGLDELLPENTRSAESYLPDDGLLARKVITAIFNRIDSILSEPIFRTDCDVPLGITVTRVEPLAMSVAGIDVGNQRFLIPFVLRSRASRDGTVEFVSREVDPEDPLLGNVIYIPAPEGASPAGGEYVIDSRSVYDAVVASSAFPLAFGRKELDYCRRPEAGEVPNANGRCPKGFIHERAEFVDGGVFDNVPLGAARALAEPNEFHPASRETWRKSARRFNYIYFDPDKRRRLGSKDREQKQKVAEPVPEPDTGVRTYGLISQLRFFGGALKTSRSYELYNTLRQGDWSEETHVYVETLGQIVSERTGKTGKTDDLSDSRPMSESECKRSFVRLFRSGGKVYASPELHRQYRCILEDWRRLEAMYRGEPLGVTPRYPGKKISGTRRRLINRLGVLFDKLGYPREAVRVRALLDDKLGDRRILLSSRFSPITGSYLFNFGAFVDRPFREYDYYAGVYDAIVLIPNYLCFGVRDRERCKAEGVRRLYREFGVAGDRKARTVVTHLARVEFPEYTRASSHWRWIADAASFPHKDNQLHAIGRSLVGDGERVSGGVLESPGFKPFVLELVENGYDTGRSSAFMKRVFDRKNQDELTWYYPLAKRALDRLYYLEEQESARHKDREAVLSLMSVAALGLMTVVDEESRFTWTQSTAPPNSWFGLLPYELGVDMRNGGLVVAWEPSWKFAGNFSMDLNVVPVQLDRIDKEDVWFSNATFYLSYNKGVVLSSFGIGPTIVATWKDWEGANRVNLGAAAYVGLFGDKLRLTYGMREFSGRGFAGDHIYLNLSVTDVQGIAYWFSKAF